MNDLDSLSLSPPVQVLPLPEAQLQAFGWRSLEAHAQVSLAHWDSILDELQQEACGHSWRSHLVDLPTWTEPTTELNGARRLKVLLSRTQAHRPTALFVYLARLEDGGQQAVAMAAISARVSQSFPHHGFPVLARCYIRPDFRGKGLYPHLVRHRGRLCEEHWGKELRAIHMGAALPAMRLALSGDLGFGTRFVHVGDEMLRVAGQDFKVEDLLSPTEGYLQELESCLPQETDGQRDFGVSLAAFLSEGTSAVSYSQLRSRWEALEVPAPLPLQQLFDLLDAIGLIR